MNLEELEQEVKKILSEERFYHSKCVMGKCAELALIYNVDIEKAKKVGIAHDIAKEMSDEEKRKYIKNNNIEIDEIEERNIGLLHGRIGKDILIKKYGFDEEMGNAVAYHSTGKENMTILEKITFLSDDIGEDRTYFDYREHLENLAKTHIDEAMIYSMEKRIEYNFKKNKEIHPISILARNYILNSL